MYLPSVRIQSPSANQKQQDHFCSPICNYSVTLQAPGIVTYSHTRVTRKYRDVSSTILHALYIPGEMQLKAFVFPLFATLIPNPIVALGKNKDVFAYQ